jgi:hypothetical protein
MTRHIDLQTLVVGAVALCLAVATPGSTSNAPEAASPSEVARPTPLLRAHAHNDYRHDRPLLDALDHGFRSVEADIHLVDGELLVAHDRHEVSADRTLRTLYLEPLRKRIEANRAKHGAAVVHVGMHKPFVLLIDIKSNAEATYRVLHEQLRAYESMLTVVKHTPGRADMDEVVVTKGPVLAVISGARPRELMKGQAIRYAGYDGRFDDLATAEPAHFMPLISDRWRSHFDWLGVRDMPADERARLRHAVKQAHAEGRMVRLWATPENEDVWDELVAADVDLINTDRLAKLRTYLLRTDQPSDP